MSELDLYQPYARATPKAGNLCAFPGCNNAAAGDIVDKQTGTRKKACEPHIREFVQERRREELGAAADEPGTRKPSVPDRLKLCLSPADVHALMSDLLVKDGGVNVSAKTKKKWRALAEERLGQLRKESLVTST